MSTAEALRAAEQVNWEDVIICGFSNNNPHIVIMSSNMPREQALWIAEHLRLHTLGRLD